MKNSRQKAIVEIINHNEVDTQTRLAELLRAAGFEATQATVSRDIKEMSLVKVATEHNTYKYALPGVGSPKHGAHKFYSGMRDSILSAELAMNLLVIKTYPGMANAICAAMDQMHFEGLVGTLAGDDTIFMAFSGEEIARQAKAKIAEISR